MLTLKPSTAPSGCYLPRAGTGEPSSRSPRSRRAAAPPSQHSTLTSAGLETAPSPAWRPGRGDGKSTCGSMRWKLINLAQAGPEGARACRDARPAQHGGIGTSPLPDAFMPPTALRLQTSPAQQWAAANAFPQFTAATRVALPRLQPRGSLFWSHLQHARAGEYLATVLFSLSRLLPGPTKAHVLSLALSII